MLKGKAADTDLTIERQKLISHLPQELKPYVLNNNTPLNLKFPVEKYPENPKSLNFSKTPEYEGVLMGVKGQYLIFEDDTVFNIRSNEGLIVGLDIGV